MLILVEDLHVGRALDVPGGNRSGAAGVEANGYGLFRLGADNDVFEVENDVSEILGNPGDRVELVQRVVETSCRDRCAGDRRKQCTP